MALNTIALGVSLTPTVVSTLFSHFLHRKNLHHKPTIHLSYDESLSVIREFIKYASKRPLEYIQEFTAQRVPAPHWVKTQRLTIPEEYLSSAAAALISQLGPNGVARVGGEEWWQWRGASDELKGEWIEMRNDYNNRKRTSRDDPSQKRIMLYIHGGAYYFGSVETHRYQLQRHARKLKGRVFAPDYRLAPQFPFPCGLQDSLAAYLFLLRDHAPNEIIFAGDSAGGGMILSLLVICRDQDIPLPAGAILISPWVDLTHSFPSVAKDNPGDYIPPSGFIHKPSVAWPPPTPDEIIQIQNASKRSAGRDDVSPSLPNDNNQALNDGSPGERSSNPFPKHTRPAFSVTVNGESIAVEDQIQMYTTNDLLFHPLVSPIFQPSLGGLPPLQILSGGGEMLRDEQFYIAHKAANPTAYAPGDDFLDEFDPKRLTLHKYPGTYVQLQVWDDLCHVAPILSFTRPAKFMYRSIAQFGAWALACAQGSEIEIINDDEISPISSDSDSEILNPSVNGDKEKENSIPPVASVGRAGDPLPAFKDRMIRQRVGKRGHIYPLDSPSSYSVLRIPGSSVGTINPQLLLKWLAQKQEWDHKYAKEKARIHQKRLKDLVDGFQDFNGEVAPPSSLAARRFAPGVLPSKSTRKSYPMTFWTSLASKHDKHTIKRENQKDSHPNRVSVDAGRAGASLHEEEVGVGASRITSLPTEDQIHEIPHLNEQPSIANVAKSNGGYNSDEKPVESVSRTPALTPLIVLPNWDATKSHDENASTRALFHASGTIPSNPDTSGARTSLHRRPSQTGSLTIRSGFTSDHPDDTSTVGDEKSLAMTGAGVDAASTRAVLHATGVVGLVNGRSSAHQSVDSLPALGASRDANGLDGHK